MLTHLAYRDRLRAKTIYQYTSTICPIVKLRNQPDDRLAERAFSGTIFSNNTNKFSLFDGQGYIIQNQAVHTRIFIFQMFN